MARWSILSMEPRTVKGNSSLKVPGSLFFLLCALVEVCVLFGSVSVSCHHEFDCSLFLPTLSYLASYRGYDRVFTVAYTFYSLVLLLFFLTCHMAYRGSNGCFQCGMMTWGVIACLVLPAIGVVDEMSTSYLLPLDMVHKALVGLFCFAGLMWILISLCGICTLRKTLTGVYRTEQRLLVQYIGIVVLSGFTASYIWYCQFYNAVNWLITDYTAALSEWLAVLTAIFLPYCYSISYPDFCLELALYSKAEKREN